jgi:ubiquinone/menaquinone biosynthesis C-methylase UbiE
MKLVTENSYELLAADKINFVLPENPKYTTRNPVSRLLITQFFRSMLNIFIDFNIVPKRVLDIGCGEGVVARQIRSLWPQAEIHSMDIQLKLLHIAREMTPTLNCFSGSAYSLPFQEASLDLTLCTEVLEHLEKPRRALKEISRVTEGHCLLSVPNEPLWRIANILRGHYLADGGNSPGHLNNWSSRSFRNLVSRYMDVITVRHPFPWTMVLGRLR